MKLFIRLWIILAAIIIPSAIASNLGVWPINPRIDAPASSTLIWVQNNNKNETVMLQARVFLWSQVDNDDKFDQQDELVISPPIVEVKPDAQQIFRVMNRKGKIATGTAERSYRILIDEVPKEDSNQSSQLQFQMRYSLPLFVGLPEGFINKPMAERLKAMATNLSYRIIKEPSPAIEIINQGPFHARLSNLNIYNESLADKNFQLNKGLFGYVLPHSAKRWPLDEKQLAAITESNIKIKFEQEHQELNLAAAK